MASTRRNANRTIHTGAAATLGCASAVASLEVPDCEIHFIVAAWVEINQWRTGIATPWSRRRVDGVEDDATIQQNAP